MPAGTWSVNASVSRGGMWGGSSGEICGIAHDVGAVQSAIRNVQCKVQYAIAPIMISGACKFARRRFVCVRRKPACAVLGDVIRAVLCAGVEGRLKDARNHAVAINCRCAEALRVR